MKPYWQHNNVLVYCGDARAVCNHLANASVDFIFTDPPYGHNNNNGDLIHNRESALGRGVQGAPRAIANDGVEANALVKWLFAESARVLKHGSCCCCCCGGGGPDPQFARWSLWLDDMLDFVQMVVWDKGPIGMGWRYRRSYETVLVGMKRGGKMRWYDDSSRIENIIRPGDLHGIRKIIPKSNNHPTEKPVELAIHFMRLHTQPGDLVLDPFMGCGSTLLAASLTGRAAIGVEVNEEYCKEAVKKLRLVAGRLVDVNKNRIHKPKWKSLL